MRFLVLISAAMGAVLSSAALAQAWIEFTSHEDRFMAQFPGEPVVEDIGYITAAGILVPGRTFTVAWDSEHYRLTAVDLTAHPEETAGAIEHAVEILRSEGEVLYDQLASSDRIPDHLLSIIAPDGRRVMAAVLLHNDRLYILEGRAPLNVPRPVQFQQSIYILDDDGNRIRLERPDETP